MKQRLAAGLIAIFATCVLVGCGSDLDEGSKLEAVRAAIKASEAAAAASVAAKELADAEARRLRADRGLLANLKAERDEMAGLTFYSAGAIHSHGNYVRLYIVEDGDRLTLRLNVRYFGDDWLFVNRAWSRMGGEIVDLPLGNDWERDNAAGKVWEWSDVRLNEYGLGTMRVLLAVKQPTIRLEGRQYYKDFKIPHNQIVAMRKVLAAYEAAIGLR